MAQAFRITIDKDENVLNLAKDRKMIICKESADSDDRGTHYHGICYEDITRQTLRNWIFAAFPEDYYYYKDYQKDHPKYGKDEKTMLGNKFYSIKKCDEVEGAERYLCKGLKDTHPDITVNNTEVDPVERYEQYWRINNELSPAIKKKKNQSHKDAFIETMYIKYDLASRGKDYSNVTYYQLVDDYKQYCFVNKLAPTPRSSGETMFMKLLNELNPVREYQDTMHIDDHDCFELWRNYYGNNLGFYKNVREQASEIRSPYIFVETEKVKD